MVGTLVWVVETGIHLFMSVTVRRRVDTLTVPLFNWSKKMRWEVLEGDGFWSVVDPQTTLGMSIRKSSHLSPSEYVDLERENPWNYPEVHQTAKRGGGTNWTSHEGRRKGSNPSYIGLTSKNDRDRIRRVKIDTDKEVTTRKKVERM